MEEAIPATTAPAKAQRSVVYTRWIPYLVAASLMAVGVALAMQVASLKKQLGASLADADQLRRSNALLNLHLCWLEAKDQTYASSKVMVAWDSYQHQGILGVDSLPPAQPGYTYQLWVLDPNALAPINAGAFSGGKSFCVKAISTDSPGFAVSLEPAPGSAEPTGFILFAIAPGQ